MHDAEDRRARSDAERQGENRRRGYDRQLRASRAQAVSADASMIWDPFAEPLFYSHRTSFRAAGARAPIESASPFFDDRVEEFFATLNDDWLRHVWLWGPRWR